MCSQKCRMIVGVKSNINIFSHVIFFLIYESSVFLWWTYLGSASSLPNPPFTPATRWRQNKIQLILAVLFLSNLPSQGVSDTTMGHWQGLSACTQRCIAWKCEGFSIVNVGSPNYRNWWRNAPLFCYSIRQFLRTLHMVLPRVMVETILSCPLYWYTGEYSSSWLSLSRDACCFPHSGFLASLPK